MKKTLSTLFIFFALAANLCAQTEEDNINNIQLPNVFSPNGDMVNDEYSYWVPENLFEYSVVIVNRWGNVMFETTDTSVFWNGTDQNSGADSPEGVYFYKLIYRRTELSEAKELHGFLHLKRE
jgi:gliding motility-associated-like protein